MKVIRFLRRARCGKPFEALDSGHRQIIAIKRLIECHRRQEMYSPWPDTRYALMELSTILDYAEDCAMHFHGSAVLAGVDEHLDVLKAEEFNVKNWSSGLWPFDYDGLVISSWRKRLIKRMQSYPSDTQAEYSSNKGRLGSVLQDLRF